MQIIIPLWEREKHDEESSTCECGPKVILENGEIILIHNAFDGRQYEEEIQRLLNEDDNEDSESA